MSAAFPGVEDYPPGLHVLSSNAPEALADALAGILSSPGDPLAPEIVLVQSVGLSRWLSLELAKRAGICANVRFVFPNAYLNELFMAVIPGLTREDGGLFTPETLRLRIMKHLPLLLDHKAFGLLARYLEDDADGRKLAALSGVIARTFDRYMLFRPQMIENWDRGQCGHWQAELWRRANRGISNLSRPALLERFQRAAGGLDHSNPALPRRLSLFGISGLPPFHFAVFSRLAEIIPVHLLHANPCREYWADIVSEKGKGRLLRKAPERSPDDLHLDQGNSLLAQMGKPGGDFLSMVQENSMWEEDFREPNGDTLLSIIQKDVLNLAEPALDGNPPRALSPGDLSIEVHETSGPLREMEAVKDLLCDLFEKSPGLSPHEVLVAAPDISVYGPLIDAVFGLAGEDAPRIPHTVAGGGLAEAGVLNALKAVLDTAEGRFEASEVMDLLALSPVSARFGLSQADCETLGQWVSESRIYWGMDGDHKRRLGLPAEHANTFRYGLDRLFLGFAMTGRDEGFSFVDDGPGLSGDGPVNGPLAEEKLELFDGIAPLSAVEASDGRLLGVLAEFVESLFSLAEKLAGPGTIPHWASLFSETAERFLLPGSFDAGAMTEFRQSLADMAGLSRRFEVDGLFGADAARAILLESMEKPPSSAGFLRQGINFASLAAARGIPFKVIILCGMNEGDFPRSDLYPGFDFMGLYPKPGDRSGREDDRYLFLETLLCAREKLVITYEGRSLKDNSQKEPSPLVSGLLDYADANFSAPGHEKTRDALLVEHRLNPWASDYFSGEGGRLFSYDSHALAASRAASGPRAAPPVFAPKPLPPVGETLTELPIARLVRFFGAPQEFFVKERLRFDPKESGEEFIDTESFEPDGLERYTIFQTVLGKRLSGDEPEDWLPRIEALGILPHGKGGRLVFDMAARAMAPVARKVKPCLKSLREPVFADIGLGGFRLSGKISGRVEDGVILHRDGLLLFRPAPIKPKDMLKAFIHHLALCATFADTASETTTLATDGSFALPPLSPEEARERLGVLLEIHRKGLSEPLLFFPSSSLAYAQTLYKEKDEGKALKAAQKAFLSTDFGRGEDADAAVSLCFKNAAPLEEPLLTDFCETARAVFSPILALWEKLP
ncbi:MAG: exodeoxyribonuclease V subunit gamma [Deltaproteobacteria bacterium]|nr:exodeoxyribonuclease V subunit gamma [Deltaproteobacteria bacterium]